MNRFCSLFSQILKFILRMGFEGAVRRLNAERHVRGVSCWQQFVSMIFCQRGRAHSLREIEQGLRNCEEKLSHLGVEAVGRFSLSSVNGHRPWQLYQNVFRRLYARCQSQLALPGTRTFLVFTGHKTRIDRDPKQPARCPRLWFPMRYCERGTVATIPDKNQDPPDSARVINISVHISRACGCAET